MSMVFMWLGIALLALWFVLVVIRLRRAFKESKALDKRLSDQLDRTAAAVQKYNKQISMRDAAILKFIHNVECGEKTCAVEPGKFCQFVRVSNFGRNYSCAVFMSDGGNTPLFDDRDCGWLMRCKACLEASKGQEG